MVDFGMILRCESPFHKDRTVIVLAGASTFGATAAAKYFVQHCKYRKGSFASIVRAEVRDGHVLSPEQVWASSDLAPDEE